MSLPLLSVIVPVYNTDLYLNECIDSILSQSFKDFELILVDDGSGDNSLRICKQAALKDSRVRVISQENQGQASARNVGLNVAIGNFITFIDSDDKLLSPDYIKVGITHLNRHKLDFVQMPYKKDGRIFNNENKLIVARDEIYKLWINGKQITNYMWDKIWRRDIFCDLKFKEGMIFEDRHLFVDLIHRCRSCAIVSGGLYLYRTHPGQTTARKRDEFFLKSMCKADCHIIDVIYQDIPNLTMRVQERLFSTFIELNALNRDSSFANEIWIRMPSLFNILKNKSPIIRMALFKLFGPRLFNLIRL